MAELATRRAPPSTWSRIRTVLWSLVLLRRLEVPRDWRVWGHALVVGTVLNAFPFTLFACSPAAEKAEPPLAGATIAGFAPSSPEAANDDLPSILRIIGALTR